MLDKRREDEPYDFDSFINKYDVDGLSAEEKEVRYRELRKMNKILEDGIDVSFSHVDTHIPHAMAFIGGSMGGIGNRDSDFSTKASSLLLDHGYTQDQIDSQFSKDHLRRSYDRVALEEDTIEKIYDAERALQEKGYSSSAITRLLSKRYGEPFGSNKKTRVIKMKDKEAGAETAIARLLRRSAMYVYDGYKRDNLVRDMANSEKDGTKEEIFSKLDSMSESEISKLSRYIKSIKG